MARGRFFALITVQLALLAALMAAPVAPARAGESSLFRGAGPKPGPALLYRRPASAPQLRNHGIWHAKPLLVSGASAYRRGEFLYQDFLYDDHGARGILRDPADPRQGSDSFSGPNGTYTYPTDSVYAENAADLVELRVKPLRRATALRITLNTMKDPSRVATTVALGASKQSRPLPAGAGATAPARRFLLVHGHRAELTTAGSGRRLDPAPRVSISRQRRQLTVRISHRAWNPGRRTVRMAAGVGLWDRGANAYLRPGISATAAVPGGALGLADPSALFNVAFRYAEPLPKVPDIVSTLTSSAWWRDKQQGAALAANDISPFHAEVDFAKLRRGVRDDMRDEPTGVPAHGPMNRIYASRFSYGQGVDYGVSCGGTSLCSGQYLGRLQPYAIYIPDKPLPPKGYGLTLLLHSLGATYNQFQGSRNQSQFGERGRGNVVISSLNRGPDGWYYGAAGADTFEMWADVAKRFRLDPRRTAIAGYSMGGYATFKYAAQFPDLFTAGQPTVGPPGLGVWIPPLVNPATGSNTNAMLASLRHVPLKLWNGTVDELVPVLGATAQVQTLDALGYRYVWDLFTVSDHFALAVNDQYAPAADFLGDRKLHPNPAHVSYVRNPSMDFAKLGTRADRAYWLSKIRLRDPEADGGLGTLDAVSEAFGRGDPAPRPTETGAGTLAGGTFPVFPFAERSKSWGKAAKTAKHDRLRLELANVKRLRVDVRRARLSCHPKLAISSDGPVRIRLAGCGRTLTGG